MSLLKAFLHGLKGKPRPDHRLAPTATIDKRIERLVAEAQTFYPHKNPEKALLLFREAIALAPPPAPTYASQERRDTGDIGFAIWAAWVCLDILGKSFKEQREYVESIMKVSPLTAQRILARLEEAERTSERQATVDQAFEVLRSPETVSKESLSAALSTIHTEATTSGAWWTLRDAAILVGKRGHGDHAWSLFNAALVVAAERKGNLPTIYTAMGDLRKAEGMYQDAACQYLLAIKSSGDDPLKRSVEQLRICLKRAGAGSNAERIRDTLLEKVQNLDAKNLIAALNTLLADTPRE